MKGLLKSLLATVLKKLIDKWLFPHLQAMAEQSENKIDDVLVDPGVVANAKKMIHLGIDRIKDKV